MHDLLKVGENQNCDLLQVTKMTVADKFKLPKVSKMT